MDLLAVEGTSGREAKVAAAIRSKLLAAGCSKNWIAHDDAHRRIPRDSQVGNLILRLPGCLRRINLKQVRDIELLDRLLENRKPVSRVVGITGAKAVFSFNEAHRPLYDAADLHVLVSMELKGSRLELFDIVGAEVPALEDVVARLPEPVDEVTAFFSLDRFEVSAVATPHVLDHDGPSHLMTRGPFAAEVEPFTLPRSART